MTSGDREELLRMLASSRRPRNPKAVEQGRTNRELIVDTVESFCNEHGYSPTRAQLAEILGLNRTTVSAHVAALLQEGRLEEAGPRTLRVATI